MTRLFSLCLISSFACAFSAQAITKQEANTHIEHYYKQRIAQVKVERAEEIKNQKITLGQKVMPYQFLKYGEQPEGGHSLYISMHGGGGAPSHVNDGQWRNQIRLYKPKEGYYLAPRAATNTWNLWHESHVDPMFERIIDNFIAFYGVNPNKVYLTGYSAGGDGTYQLAPRMADRWAGAAMMAGHPGDAQAHNLNNLPYFIQCGGKDTAYKRNEHAKNWGLKLDALEAANPGEYPHKTIVYPQHGHWMNLDCKQAIPWMAKNTRNPWPTKLNWYQDDVTHTRFAWFFNDAPKQGDFIKGRVHGNTITLDSKNVKTITLRLSDQLVDLEKPVIVKNKAGKVLFNGKVERTTKAIETSLNQRLDKTAVATALLKVTL